MSSVLILGAGGFLGSAMVNEFQGRGLKVGALSRSDLSLNSNKIEKHHVDILDYRELESAISQYNFIINCTGQISNPINQCLVQNTRGISNIVRAVKKHNKKLIQFSSISVYGTSEYVDEESGLNPETSYASMKCFSEFIVNHNLDSSWIFRISNLYGKNQTKGIVSYLTRQYLSGVHNLHFNNNGTMRRYYLNVSELAYITYLAIHQGLTPGVYNIIGKEALTIKELVEKFSNILNYSFFVKYSKLHPIEDVKEINDVKIRTGLGIDIQSAIESHIINIRR